MTGIVAEIMAYFQAPGPDTEIRGADTLQLGPLLEASRNEIGAAVERYRTGRGFQGLGRRSQRAYAFVAGVIAAAMDHAYLEHQKHQIAQQYDEGAK